MVVDTFFSRLFLLCLHPSRRSDKIPIGTNKRQSLYANACKCNGKTFGWIDCDGMDVDVNLNVNANYGHAERLSAPIKLNWMRDANIFTKKNNILNLNWFCIYQKIAFASRSFHSACTHRIRLSHLAKRRMKNRNYCVVSAVQHAMASQITFATFALSRLYQFKLCVQFEWHGRADLCRHTLSWN